MKRLNTIMNGWEADLDKTNKVAPELSRHDGHHQGEGQPDTEG